MKMLQRKRKLILLVCLLIGGGVLIWHLNFFQTTPAQKFDGSSISTVLWWTSMPAAYESTRTCGLNICRFTTNRNHLSFARTVLFYASDMKVDDFPLPRDPAQLWALIHDESPRNVPFVPHNEILRHFNLTSTFSRYSDFPLTTQYLPSVKDLLDRSYMGPSNTIVTGLVAFLQSDCDTMSGREDYIRELMRYIRVDSFGSCLKNRDLPKNLQHDYLNNLYSPDLYRFLRKYKYIIAYENGVCNDYITEKYWRPLIIGVIPIYFGSPTIRDWEPNKKSAIYINDFESPQKLAEFLQRLDDNETEYATYLQHKGKGQPASSAISNQLLLNTLLTREYAHSQSDLFAAVECFVCKEMMRLSPTHPQQADARHYDCPLPLVYPRMKQTTSNSWESIMAVGRCQAKVLDKLLQRNVNYTRKEFDRLVMQKVSANECN